VQMTRSATLPTYGRVRRAGFLVGMATVAAWRGAESHTPPKSAPALTGWVGGLGVRVEGGA